MHPTLTGPMAAAVGQLERLPDVSRFKGLGGQVMIYPGHRPPGVFIVLAGTLRVGPLTPGIGRAGSRKLVAGVSSLIVPPLDELEEPAVKGVAIEQRIDTLFIPRSLIATNTELRQMLERLPLSPCSLR